MKTNDKPTSIQGEAEGDRAGRSVKKASRKSAFWSGALALGAVGVSAQSLKAQDAGNLVSVEAAQVLPDGSLSVVLSDGRSLSLSPDEYEIVDGAVVIDPPVAEALGLAGSGSGLSLPLLGGVAAGVVALVGGAAALAGGGDSGGSGGDGSANEAPVFTSGATATASVTENTETAVYTPVVTDADGDPLTFTLSGTDAALFEIDEQTGAVTFINAPDYEAPGDDGGDNAYNIVITASDGTNSTDQDVTITVTDEEVEFTSGATASVAENAAVGTVVYTAEATTDTDGSTLTFALSGTDAALFNIDEQTGAVTLNAVPDYEAPGDADGDNAYNIVITASDGANSTDQAVTITVTNENDEVPVFASGATATASVPENTEAAVYTPTVTDADGDPLTFSLSGTDAALFNIDEQTGAVTFIDAPDYEAPGDDGGDNAYNIVITASDGTNSTDQDVTITVTDEEVEFTSGATASVAENAAVGTVVYTAEATTDTDGSTLTFALSGTDAALFEIDEQTGAVTLNAVPDYEAPGDADGDNAYNIVITASDGANSTDQAVTITVTNENDEVPVFASGATATASVPENTEAAVYTPTVTDADGDPLTFSLSGTDAALFNIDEQTGAVTFIDAPDYEAPGDDGGDNAYNIVITASDGTNSTDQDVTITVTDEEVEFTSGATASVAENAAVGTVVYTAEATTDTDGSTLTFALSGTDAALFNIDEQTGAVTLNAVPDYEAPGDADGDNAYNIVITASDGANSTDQAVTITVTNENDEVPVFASGATATASVPENTEAAVYTPTVTDADGDPLTFSLSGTDAALFNIDEQTGAVTFIDAPDYEAPGDDGGDNAYNIVITASDGTNSTDQDVTITVTDEEVEFTSGATASVAENAAVGTVVYTAEATTDTDGSTLTFALSGTDAALFEIDEQTGAVTLNAVPDYEAPGDADGDNAYNIVITASDGANSTDQAVTITVTNENDEVPVFASGATATASVPENTEAAVYTPTVTDADGDPLTFSLSGTDAALFNIDEQTGAVTFIDAPDYEAPGDDGGDNAYNIVITASDGTNSTDQDVTITVTDVEGDDEAPVFTSEPTVSVPENTETAVYTPTVTDADGGPLTFALSGGADQALFEINEQTGAVTFIDAPDYEAPGDDGGDNAYNIVITASDGTNSTDQDVTITVTNVEGEPASVLDLSNISTAEGIIIQGDGADGITTFKVTGDTGGDQVTLTDTGWSADGQQVEDNVTFNVYENGQAEIWIEEAVTVSM